MPRAIAYIDGFNLYFGLRSRGWRRFYWLDLPKLASALIRPAVPLSQTRYFTSRVAGGDRQRRQATYIEALRCQANLSVHFGHYLLIERRCRNCGHSEQVPTEKMTDVNIATELLTDAFQDAFDTALVVTADSDLTSPIQTVRRLFPSKRIIVAFPPGRFSITLSRVASAYVSIERNRLAQSQLPDQITKPGGFVLHRPTEWR